MIDDNKAYWLIGKVLDLLNEEIGTSEMDEAFEKMRTFVTDADEEKKELMALVSGFIFQALMFERGG